MRARRNGRKRHGEKLLPLIEDETAGFNGVVIRRSKEGGRGEEQMCVRKHGATAGEVSGRERRCSSTAEGEPAARASSELSDESCVNKDQREASGNSAQTQFVRSRRARKNLKESCHYGPLAREREEEVNVLG